MKVAATSDWAEQEIADYMQRTIIPMRIAVVDQEFPLLASLWFRLMPEEGEIQCVSHASSKLVKALIKNNRCAFEIAPNEPPYFGVRGTGEVLLTQEGAPDALAALIERYLGNDSSQLAKWLLSRAEDEYLIRISPRRISAWDYSDRM
jgi:hypothetical protein